MTAGAGSVDIGVGDRAVIVVGIDFSEGSAYALEVARDLARALHNPEIHAVHVLRWSAPAPPAFVDLTVDASEAAAAAFRRLEQTVASFVRGLDVRAVSHVRIGSPERGIVEVAREVDADLVIVGATHGGVFARLLKGSVAPKVMRLSPCAVLAVKRKEHPSPPAEAGVVRREESAARPEVHS